MPHRSRFARPAAIAALLLLAACGHGAIGGLAGSGEAPATGVRASPSGAYLAAAAALARSDMAAAADYLQTALAAAPGERALMRKTHIALLAAGRMEEALAVARRMAADEVTGGGVPPQLTLATAALAAEAPEAAAEALSTLPADGFGGLLGPLFEGWARAAAGDVEAALAALGPLAADDDPLRAHHVAMVQEFAGRTEEALAAYRHAAAREGGNWRTVTAYGALLERQGRGGEAATLYRSFLASRPDALRHEETLARLEEGAPPPPAPGSARQGVAEALLTAAGLAQEGGREAHALAFAQLAVWLAPESDTVALLAGDVFAVLDANAAALAVWERIAGSDAPPATGASSPLAWSAGLRMAFALDALGDTEGALASLTRMTGERPGRFGALVVMADLLREHERWAEAVAAYDGAFERMGAAAAGHWWLHYMRGIALERAGLWERAESDFVAALEIRPEHPFVLNYLGYSWVDRGERLDEALAMIRRAVAQRPEDGFIIDSLGWAFFRLGRFEDAVAQLERAVEYVPDDAIVNDHLGDAYWMVGRYQEARFQWRRVLRQGEADAELAAAVQAKLRSGLDGGGDG